MARSHRSGGARVLNPSTLLDTIASQRPDFAPARFGRLAACDGGLLEVTGLSVPIGTLARVEHRPGHALGAEVIGFRGEKTLMMLLGDAVLLRPGAIVRSDPAPGLLPVGEAFLGRAVDAMARPLDGGGPVRASRLWPAGGERSGPLERAPVRETFDCGVRAVNALTTLGIGQRMGIVAGSGVGKSVLLDMIASHARADVVVVGLIGERAREVSDFVERHLVGPHGARTAVVAVPADHAPNLRLRGALLATSLAEHFREQGHRVLLILDSLTRVAHAAREIALLLGEPAAARGYPPSALATLTRLIERAGNSAASAGAITGIYTVLADGDDHDDPVVDTARAILDGHVVLSRALAQRGQYPAIDVAASLSRVMSAIVSPSHLAAAREFRSLSATYEANRDLVLMGAYREGTDPTLDRANVLHGAMTAFLGQAVEAPVTLADSIAQLSRVLGHDA